MITLEGEEWVAHCLDLDIVEVGRTPDKALDALAGAVTAQLLDAREHDNFSYLFRPAPPEAWRKFGEIFQGPHQTLTRVLQDPGRDFTLDSLLAAA